MSSAQPTWFELREPLDHQFRSQRLAAAFCSHLEPGSTVDDFAAGTGSNLRYLATLAAPGSQWIAVDSDAAGLESAIVPGFEVSHRCYDFKDGFAGLALPANAAVTTSAFLDMCSAVCLDDLARACTGLPVLAAMSFDGRLEWNIEAPDDAQIYCLWLVTRRRDFGLGPSLGPDAAGYLA